ncbi:hypothetical protein PYCCODRAFT_1095698 [Trametes coccinea BRFM310]|uniref:Uncharacterized protein n=1 Tax=Trametes coccinea (strain BRFM310) TaxID=1353009 RepID=A0A1Y2I9P9_TRAC3|nr:hypothetical protein PYCCODRAFT_1095698 [Trametes coccinea BRFM310]
MNLPSSSPPPQPRRPPRVVASVPTVRSCRRTPSSHAHPTPARAEGSRVTCSRSSQHLTRSEPNLHSTKLGLPLGAALARFQNKKAEHGPRGGSDDEGINHSPPPITPIKSRLNASPHSWTARDVPGSDDLLVPRSAGGGHMHPFL